MQDPSRPATGYPVPPYAQPNGGYPPPPPAAYPYPARNQQYYYPNPDPAPYRPLYNRRLIRILFAVTIGVIVILSVSLFIVWLVLRPTFPDFHVDSLTVINFSANSSRSITGTWQVGLRVFNTNKKLSVNYDALKTSIFYKSDPLAEAPIPPFKQATRALTPLNVTLSAIESYVGEWVVNGINGDRARGSVKFNLKVLAGAWFQSGGWRTRTRLISVLCSELEVGVKSNGTSGTLINGAKECRVF